MNTQTHSLKRYNTFGIDVNAMNFISLTSIDHLRECIIEKKLCDENVLILGSGSNILFTKDYNGIIIHPEFNNIEIIDERKNEIDISAEAGVIWDDLVQWTVNRNYGGLENLSNIPGTVGAAPVQNIGAYGVEIKDSIIRLETMNMNTADIKFFGKAECGFSYRNSIFKNEAAGKYFITKVYFRLSKNPDSYNTSYGSLPQRIAETGVLSLASIRETIITIRKEKLPEPEITGNAGSFFRNPIVNSSKLNSLRAKYPEIPSFPFQNKKKISAAWLIDQCGWKGFRERDAGVHNKHALVLVNHGQASGKEIYDLSARVILSVKQKFGIQLEPEVRII